MDPEIIDKFMAALARAAWQRPEMTDEEAIASVETDFHISGRDITQALVDADLYLAAGGS